ncbi:DUF2155 domain-containing protein [Caulobacter mirabilis]|uniref:DUF2155 domain-containing protein n=1 Tax=Caulobacter mirabilis TaxID=69666 RepID=A0A2D2AYW3_9CAUL|nr:DUF2155 domain-containing protein [Caulobacter mirabilis]ATQ43206.1 hypothetical protein CSW64_12660 [Caulobacter mirabilis]
MRLRLTLLAGLAVASAAGLVQARQQTPAPKPATPTAQPAPAPAAPLPAEPEEAPPGPISAAPKPPPPPEETAREKPAVTEKPKTQAVEKPAEPLRRTRGGAAIIQALDKVTAETLRFEAPIGQAVRYKSLVITVRACETTASDEDAQDSAAYMTIDSQPKPPTGRAPPPPRQVFRGWMYASSPGLNPLEHPVYDAWLIACRASGPAPAKR